MSSLQKAYFHSLREKVGRCNLLLLVAGAYTTLAHAQTFPPIHSPKLADGYTRYAVPSQCVAAIRRETQTVWRGRTFSDTTAYSVLAQRALIPPSAAQAAEQCLTHSSTSALQPADHIAMIELALLAQREDAMNRFLDSVLARGAAARDSEQRLWVVQRLLSVFPGTHVVFVEPLRYTEPLKRLLSVVPCEDATLCRARQNILFLLRRDARARGHFAAAAAVADSLVSLRRQVNRLPTARRDESGRLHVYPRTDFFHTLARWYDDTTLATGPTSGSAGVPSAWERVRKGMVEVGDNPDNPFVEYPDGNRHYRFMDSLFRLNVPVKVPVLTPQAWVSRTGAVSAPPPGRVLLIVNTRGQSLSFGARAMLRRLHDRYAASGFDIVWVMASQGHFEGSSVLTFAEEQKALADYWFGYYNVPGVIALDQTTFSRRPDNRLVPQPTAAGAGAALSRLSVRAGRSGGAGGIIAVDGLFLVDRNGNLITPAYRFEMTVSRHEELVLARMIEHALAASKGAK